MPALVRGPETGPGPCHPVRPSPSPSPTKETESGRHEDLLGQGRLACEPHGWDFVGAWVTVEPVLGPAVSCSQEQHFPLSGTCKSGPWPSLSTGQVHCGQNPRRMPGWET